MPFVSQTEGNEVFAFDICPDFSGGQASAPRANLLNQNQAALLQNCEFDTQGILRTRRGTRQYQSVASPGFLGGFTINLPDNKIVTVVAGTSLLSCLAPNVLSAFPGQSLLGAAHTGITGVFGTGIITDTAHGYANGTVVAFSVIAGGTGLTITTPYFVISATANTYLLAAVSSGASVPFSTNITSGTISTVGSFVPGVNVISCHGQTGTYYSDGQSPVVFCNGKTAVPRPEIPVGSILAWHTNRLVVGGIPGRPATLKFSGILNDKLWLTNFSIDIGNNDGDPIVAVQSYQDYLLIVYKRNSVWIVNADPTSTNAQGQLSASSWFIQSLPGALGCVAARTVAIVGNDVWFMAQDGVRIVARAEFTNAQFDVIEPSSAPVRDYMRRFNRSAPVGTACAISFEGLYFLALPLDGSLVNNIMLVYRQISKSWMGVWTIPAQGFIIDTISVPHRMMIACTDNTLREWLNYYQDFQADFSCFQDLGVGYNTIVRTRAMIFGEIMSGKQMQNFEVEFFQSRSQSTTISASIDSAADVPLLVMDTEANAPLTFPWPIPTTLQALGVRKRGSSLRQLGQDARELQLVITNTDTLPITFRYCSAAATVQPLPLETN